MTSDIERDLGHSNPTFALPQLAAQGTLTMVRHGESRYNERNLFTGWTDIDLSDRGRREMRAIGRKLRPAVYARVFSSDLRRSVIAAGILIDAADWDPAPEVEPIFELRGRDDGDLVGLDKTEAADRYGDSSAPKWRKDFFLRLPGGESLADVTQRVLPFARDVLLPSLQRDESVLAVVHGNTIRALLVALGLSTPESIESVWLPNAAVVTTTLKTSFMAPVVDPNATLDASRHAGDRLYDATRV